MPHGGPDAVGADQRQRHFLLPRHAAALDHGQSLGMGGDILELAAEPQLDIGMVVDMGLQRRLQIGAMHHPIGRAGAQGGRFAERQPGDFAAASRAHDADGVGRDGASGQPWLAGRDRSARGWHWAIAAARRRLPRAARPSPERRRESLVPPAPAPPSVLRSRRRRRRSCVTPPPADQATLSFTTHSGGRASPAARSAA